MTNKDITILPDITIMEALRALDLSRKKVVLVVDDNERLIGCLSAGDIRRYILKYNDINGSIQRAYNKKPIYVYEDKCDIQKVERMLVEKRLELIPILDKHNKVVDCVTWDDAHYEKTEYKPKRKISALVVIMAGGQGTRLDPFTKILPKPLMPIGNRPIIELIIDKFMDYGMQDYYLIVNHMSKVIKAYLRESPHPYSIRFIEEDKPLGTAGGLQKLIGKIEGPFFVSNCDIIVETDYGDLYEFHRRNNFDITLVGALKNYIIPYGICEMSNDGDLEKLNEKPEYNFLVNTGLYIINGSVLDVIPENQLFHITDLIEKVRQNEGRVGVFPVNDKAWIDIGEWAEYRKTLKAFGL